MRRNRPNRDRQFNSENVDNLRQRESFPFPFEVDGDTGEKIDFTKTDSVRRRSSQDGKTKSNTPQDTFYERRKIKRPTSHTITKARRVPSAIYGTKNPHQKEQDPKEIYGEKFKNYNSSLVESIVRKRKEREKRELERQKRLRKLGHTYKLSSSIAPLNQTNQSDEDNKEILVQVEKENNEIPLPFKADLSNRDKRRGPSITLPPINMLGKEQDMSFLKYNTDDFRAINEILDTVGVEGRATVFESNGVIGRYGIKLEPNFKLTHIDEVKRELEAILEIPNVRIYSQVLGNHNIAIEFPIKESYPIYFKSVFMNSGLKLRKNDFKFVLGKTVDNKIFGYELRKAGHVLIYGNADGKSNVIDSVLISMLMNHTTNEFQFKIFSETLAFKHYEKLPQHIGNIQSVLGNSALHDIIDELNKRNIQFRRAHVRNIQSFNTRVKNESKKSTIIVYIDNVADLFESNNIEAMRAVVQILKQGKALGIHLILNHDRTDVGIRYELLHMLQTKISYYDEKSTVIDGADKLIKGNDVLVTIPTSNRPVRLNLAIAEERMKQDIIDYISKTDDEG
ncbi:DNA translocase FtsK [Phocicoccus pinnipedialis]|uniref:DNA translocase SftA n=1 Tax=Phocicoccus pinnipedialis TaxID=110845 RepID=A0A6V7RDI4_9BACL|nr:DNA translocase FtsK [Jeotgalicoccus pinnipedialis]MBP1939545.1 S-DNA-T family DNA segregation ATPase FtsK/SpoIIIE [Jeotgalicoccus pinnipedialis]CAD2074981.1 DNA translocase SftA [Jeotgalicoccus pinnipedialis]